MKAKTKNPAAVELGRLGGKARKRNLSRAKLSASAKYAANVRWGKVQPQEPTEPQA